MHALVILALTIIAGAVMGLIVLQLAHEMIIRRVYPAPSMAEESIDNSATLLRDAAARHPSVN